MAVHVLECLHAIAQLEKLVFLKIHIRHPWRFILVLCTKARKPVLFAPSLVGRSKIYPPTDCLLCSNETPIVTT